MQQQRAVAAAVAAAATAATTAAAAPTAAAPPPLPLLLLSAGAPPRLLLQQLAHQLGSLLGCAATAAATVRGAHTSAAPRQAAHAAPAPARADDEPVVAPQQPQQPLPPFASASAAAKAAAAAAARPAPDAPALTFAAAGAAAAAPAPGDDPGGDASLGPGVLDGSAQQQQYRQTLEHLYAGHSRGLGQLAAMFDAKAVLAPPDRGAPLLEALLFGAAKLGDLPLLRRVLRCLDAAGAPLTGAGHAAVLHGLAAADRPKEALDWLARRVPPGQLAPRAVRLLVMPLLKHRRVAEAERVLAWAAQPGSIAYGDHHHHHHHHRHQGEEELGASAPAAAAAAPAAAAAAAAAASPHDPWLDTDRQLLPCMRLMVAAAGQDLSAVQAAWADVRRDAEQRAASVAAAAAAGAAATAGGAGGGAGEAAAAAAAAPAARWQLQAGVVVWASYVSALGRAGRVRPDDSHALMRAAVDELADACHATAWARWRRQVLASGGGGAAAAAAGSGAQQQQQQQQQQEQEQQAPPRQEGPALAAAALRAEARGRRLWHEAAAKLGGGGGGGAATEAAPPLPWAELPPPAAAGLPHEVAACLRHEERRLVRRALDAAAHMAATQLDGAWMRRLLQQAQLLRAPPGAYFWDALLNLRLWRGAPPEALEELLAEAAGWGVAPALSHYEHVAEAYALHRDPVGAERVLDRVQAAGLAPLLRTYNRLLHGAALNGDIAAAARLYARLRAQGLAPDEQTMRALFKAVRLNAANARVAFARRLARARAGDRDATAALMSQRAAHFAAAYTQLAEWQAELVAAGLKHTPASLHHLLGALERLGAVEDCVQLAGLHERLRPGSFGAHRAALQAAGRARRVEAAGEAAALAARVTSQGGALGRRDFLGLINSQFWLHGDHQQLLQTVAAMRAAGHALDEAALLQLVHVYAHRGLWGDALRALDDFAAGRYAPPDAAGAHPDGQTDAAASYHHRRGRQPRARHGSWSPPPPQPGEGGAGAGAGAGGAGRDAVWHVVMRKLWERRAPDDLLHEVLRRMDAPRRQRFKLLYGLTQRPDGSYTLTPPDEDDDLQMQQQQQQQQVGAGGSGGEAGTSSSAVAAAAAASAELRLPPGTELPPMEPPTAAEELAFDDDDDGGGGGGDDDARRDKPRRGGGGGGRGGGRGGGSRRTRRE